MRINTTENKLMCELYDLLKQSLNGFKASATRQKLDQPNFTVMEFLEWVYNQDNFNEISVLWQEANYAKLYKPKMIIVNLYEGRYNLDNFKLSNFDAVEKMYIAQKAKAKNEPIEA